MFFVSPLTGTQTTYRVEEIQKDPQEQERRFKDPRSYQLFLEAQDDLKKKKVFLLIKEMIDTNAILLNAGLIASEALDKIKHSKGNYFPVVNEKNEPVGLVTFSQVEEGKEKTLKELVATKTLCAKSTVGIHEIIDLFIKEGVEAIPIVDEDSKVIGVLDRRNLIDTILKVIKLHP